MWHSNAHPPAWQRIDPSLETSYQTSPVASQLPRSFAQSQCLLIRAPVLRSRIQGPRGRPLDDVKEGYRSLRSDYAVSSQAYPQGTCGRGPQGSAYSTPQHPCPPTTHFCWKTESVLPFGASLHKNSPGTPWHKAMELSKLSCRRSYLLQTTETPSVPKHH